MAVLYVTAKEAENALGMSQRSLLRLRNAGILKVGECWIRKIPTNANSDILYDLKACKQALINATLHFNPE